MNPPNTTGNITFGPNSKEPNHYEVHQPGIFNAPNFHPFDYFKQPPPAPVVEEPTFIKGFSNGADSYGEVLKTVKDGKATFTIRKVSKQHGVVGDLDLSTEEMFDLQEILYDIASDHGEDID